MALTDDPSDPRLGRYTGPEEAAPQHEVYLVLSEADRAKGFVRPYRELYIHDRCGSETRMGRALSETWACDNAFYGATYCCKCQAHFPVGEFRWAVDGQVVGS